MCRVIRPCILSGYFVAQYCRTVLFTISSDTIQNMFSTLVKNLKKERNAGDILRVRRTKKFIKKYIGYKN